MSIIQSITTDDLRRMENQEGLVLQGCGGDPQEWVDGVNELLAGEGILLNGSRFETASVFRRGDLTNMLFPFEGVSLDMGKLAVWRLSTHDVFGGTWLSDYVTIELGGFIQEQPKPFCPLIGADGNIFSLLGIASRTLRDNGMSDKAREMTDRVTGGDCHSYYDALNIIGEYVEITDSESLENDHHRKKEKNAYDR